MRPSAPIRAAGLAAGVICVTAGGVPAAGAEGAPLECGAPYLVGRGDSLQEIAERAYGPEASYRTLHKANRALIGRNASQLEIGATIEIPCLDAAGEPIASVIGTDEVESSEDAPRAATPEQDMSPQEETAAHAPTAHAPAAAPPEPARPLRIVAATGWAPFLDEDRREGGMLAEILAAALSRVMAPGEFRIDFINDRGAHLDPLLADLAYDVSLAWARPDCDQTGKLGDESRRRCRDLVWSDPLFEQVIGYYTRADETPPTDHRALIGRTLCRPETRSLAMMEAVGLVEPDIVLKRPATALACFEMLLGGEVDVVVIASTVADEALTTLKAHDMVAEQPQLAAVATLHAVTSVKNPRGARQMARIDEGLRLIRGDGTWFAIVRRHLIDHARKSGGEG